MCFFANLLRNFSKVTKILLNARGCRALALNSARGQPLKMSLPRTKIQATPLLL